jgi:hypothetical protein
MLRPHSYTSKAVIFSCSVTPGNHTGTPLPLLADTTPLVSTKTCRFLNAVVITVQSNVSLEVLHLLHAR